MFSIYSLLSPVLLTIIIAAIKISDNDKAPFLILLPLVYSLILALLYIIQITKNYHLTSEIINKHLYVNFFVSITPIIYVLLIAILSRKGLINSEIFLGFK